jgi:Ca-activated chloride channel family protein
VESFRPELQRFDDETRKAALGYVEALYAGGSTNIDGALKSALAQLHDSSRPNFVIFLTDGLPTDGERQESKIVAAAQAENQVRARLFVFGVGYDVNSRLLDRLARVNFGQSDYVRPNEDIEARVSALYTRIGSPVLTDLAIRFDVEGVAAEQGTPINRTYPAITHDLFAGEQLVLVGRYKHPGAARVEITGKVGGEQQKFDFPAKLVEKSPDSTNGFIEKLWAVRRVGEIIDELDLKGKNDELVTELVRLATKHGILTPYTSFLADDQTDRHNLAANAAQAHDALRELNRTEGQGAFEQRVAKGQFQKAARAADAEAAAEKYAASAPTAAPQAGLGGQANGLAGRAVGARTGAFAAGARQAAGKVKAQAAIQRIGRKTFYRQAEGWVDADVTQTQQQNVQKIERFGQQYFDLIDKHGPDVAKYLAIDEPVTVEIDGQAYSF